MNNKIKELKEILITKMKDSEEFQKIYYDLGRHDLEQYHKGVYDNCHMIYNLLINIERGAYNDTSN